MAENTSKWYHSDTIQGCVLGTKILFRIAFLVTLVILPFYVAEIIMAVLTKAVM